jgi:HEPN domain-containing protein
MKGETKRWLQFAEENFQSAQILAESKLFNPCLQNVQQSIEKAIKALLIEKAVGLKRTHSIFELKQLLSDNGVALALSDDDCDFLDSIYLPTRYPLAGVLPEFEPTIEICIRGIELAGKVLQQVSNLVQGAF